MKVGLLILPNSRACGDGIRGLSRQLKSSVHLLKALGFDKRWQTDKKADEPLAPLFFRGEPNTTPAMRAKVGCNLLRLQRVPEDMSRAYGD